ncbi:hypothetical protein C0Q70_10235 [Pomacea canaliculata]|uniref:Uncharacterized protein n=1 Tax=Pomacea canaliculata TaxID=400727 RepID=A0A2T7PC21_POMCA|nr:hypothetical protein C0Q70_10235 [Pomacea canaliculata]
MIYSSKGLTSDDVNHPHSIIFKSTASHNADLVNVSLHSAGKTGVQYRVLGTHLAPPSAGPSVRLCRGPFEPAAVASGVRAPGRMGIKHIDKGQSDKRSSAFLARHVKYSKQDKRGPHREKRTSLARVNLSP